MLFNSYEFVFVYLPVAFLGFILTARVSRILAMAWLVLASLAFYSWWNPKFVSLLLASATFNYLIGRVLGSPRWKSYARVVLTVAIAANLGLLFVFKYANFFVATANSISQWRMQLPDIVLPLGISFFTFTQIGFLVDVYRGVTRECSYIRYVLFVSYFPHLIAGPILQHDKVMPQFSSPETYRFSAENVMVGFAIFIVWLSKKTLLADSFSGYVSPVFESARLGAGPNLCAAWAGALAYSFQIYFDFSGYSDMAVGLSRLFGIRLPFNFNSPYKAESIVDFWRRWHITLSQFLRNYLYVPLGGARAGKMRRYANVAITMLLGGLWHGASWTFVAWGGLHALYIAINVAWRARSEDMMTKRLMSSRLGRFFRVGVTFLAVMFGWVLFRADSFATALTFLKGMAGVNGIYLPESLGRYLGSDYVLLFPPIFSFIGVFADIDGLGSPYTLLILLIGGCFLVPFPSTQLLIANYY